MALVSNLISGTQALVREAGTFGLNGFVFDICEDGEIELSSEITDHYVEDGTAIQDHIALKPEKVTLRGYVGEYSYPKKDQRKELEKISQKLTVISSYLPVIDNTANKVWKRMKDIKNNDSFFSFSNTKNLYGIAKDSFQAYKNINIPKTKQGEAFLFFEALRNSRTLLTVETPYRSYTDMAIETIRMIQHGNSLDISDIEVTLKKIRFAKVESSKIVKVNSKLKEMKFKKVAKGIVSGNKVKASSIWGKTKNFVGGK